MRNVAIMNAEFFYSNNKKNIFYGPIGRLVVNLLIVLSDNPDGGNLGKIIPKC